jgi:hypothetical protein
MANESAAIALHQGRLADANDLIAALVVAMYLGHPIQQMRPFPPTLYQ